MLELFRLLILSLHVLGGAVIIGGIFASLLILIKEKVAKENLEFLQILWKFLTPAIGLQIVTGIYLAVNDWNKFGKNPLFWVKVGLLVADGFFGGKVLGDRIKAMKSKEKFVEIPGRKLIWFALLIFITIATLGVFLAESHQ